MPASSHPCASPPRSFRQIRSARVATLIIAVLGWSFDSGELLAQAFPRVAGSPPPYQRPPWPDDNGKGSRGWGSFACSSSSALDAVLEYWSWNRDAYLPQPARKPVRLDVEAAARTATAGGRDWLLESVASGDASDRAAALLVIGALGPAFGGRLALERAIEDEDPKVRRAALLALGEHGGAAARFRLAQELADDARGAQHRRLAALAFGVASAVDGGAGGRALRPFAAAASQVLDRAFVCAADELAGGLAIERAATDWLLDKRGLRVDGLPGAAIVLVGPGVPDGKVRARITGLSGSRSAPLRLAARRALAVDAIDAATMRAWIKAVPKVGGASRTVMALASNPLLPEVVAPLLRRPSLRAPALLALGVHARQRDEARARAGLGTARRVRKVFVNRPLWLLADALAGTSGAAARAIPILRDTRSPEKHRLVALDVLGLVPGADLAVARQAVHLDPSPTVRLHAADVVARHGTPEGLDSLRHAIARAGTPGERVGLLVALGRTRHPAAERELERWCRGAVAEPEERAAAWRGLLLCLRRGGSSALARLPRGVAYAYLPGELTRLVAAMR